MTMIDQRPKLFDSDDSADFDISGFQPTKPARQNPKVASVAAEKAGFQSRETKPSTATPKLAATAQRRRRTGRTAQLNLKATPETVSAFYAIADAQGWGLGETLEKAVELLLKNVK